MKLGDIMFDGVHFDSRLHRLVVADQIGGPGSKWMDSQRAGEAFGGIAAINAGFFTPEGDPLGLVVSEGNPRGYWNRASSLGSAVWYEDRSGRSGITRREKLGKSAAVKMRELVQAGPLLVEQRKAVGGLDKEKVSARTILLWDGEVRWMLARTSPCSLAKLGQTLAGASISGWKVKTALNLDGGRSSELWISSKLGGSSSLTRPIWNKPVRNFLVLTTR